MSFYNDSKFNMWRACIAAIWLDGRVSSEERTWIEEKIKSLQFTDAQRSTLTNDLSGKVDFVDVIDKVTDKKDRAFLVHQIRVIGHLDGTFSSEEKEKMEIIRKFVLENIDLAELEQKITEDDTYKLQNKNLRLERLVNYFQKK